MSISICASHAILALQHELSEIASAGVGDADVPPEEQFYRRNPVLREGALQKKIRAMTRQKESIVNDAMSF